MLLHDQASNIPLFGILNRGDLLLLLTPVVFPLHVGSSRDPFEPLGKALAKHHPWVRHVPYTARGGITSTHVGFIKRARIVVFVICGPPSPGQPSQVEMSNLVQGIGERRPHIVVTCCEIRDLDGKITSSPTVLQLSGYSSRELEAGADILFHGQPEQSPAPTLNLSTTRQILDPTTSTPPPPPPTSWKVTAWNQARDVPDIYELWNECMPPQFKLRQASLLQVLQRDGYANHYIVRQAGTNRILGFCATYITYLDSKGDVLVGSIATLLVRTSHQCQGIGSRLHEEAMRGFKKTRGVSRLQLGSTFPRIFYGLPTDHPAEAWFKRRGWRMDGSVPGAGQETNDWLLAFNDWPTGNYPSLGVSFKPCGFGDFERVLEVAEQVASQNNHMGWYDQYAKLADSMAMSDIVIGVRGDEIVATAITYTMHSDNPTASDIPWAGLISDDTGGVTCICITDLANRDTLMVRLLDTCVQTLRQQGKNRMYIDAVKGGEAGFPSIGFQKWATYRDVWMDV
ncbi:hypothetical protein BD289DRAFT_461359 [Coniella lustricola]|uniref:N-acetyltransferase domain-containing protein n=1 Tax=Coniella lustricola TaxID=2025994 RepID=A0A2T3A5S6_9PEZI|nr:hypothetical protein BD289DRAFT_461359 [Coniella lustricola]